jgi:hypothetical protein
VETVRSSSSTVVINEPGDKDDSPLNVDDDDDDDDGVLFSFLAFMRLFWNQILIWRSVRQSACAISTRRLLVR